MAPRSKLRRGAILPLFAIIFPVIVVICGFAINLAYLQLASTEIKAGTDAAAHAAGRAMSIHQTTDDAQRYARIASRRNYVANKRMNVRRSEADVYFGTTDRLNNGFGMYTFSQVSKAAVDANTVQATSVAVEGKMDLPFLLPVAPSMLNFSLDRRSIATQVDRDIALVLDRSGSMDIYKDEDELDDVMDWLYNNGQISRRDRNNAKNYPHSMSWDVVDELWQRRNNSFFTEVYQYAYDRRYAGGAPRHSRWDLLDDAVDAFLNVLETTDQEELVSLTTFASSASKETDLEDTYFNIRNKVSNINPNGSTAIGKGLQTGLPPIISGSDARPFAAKTIIVLTDGYNNVNPTPQSVASSLVVSNNVTIHTVTFTKGADQSSMQTVADRGHGRHYHADNGSGLIAIFEEIANNLPTILTE
jgi:Flp pilus assembly protein TadG